MMKSSTRPARSDAHRGGEPARDRLLALSLATAAVMALALALVFFYAPLDAEQGFLQKIFYVHVPLAIVALCGFVGAALLAVMHLRTREARRDARAYVALYVRLF